MPFSHKPIGMNISCNRFLIKFSSISDKMIDKHADSNCLYHDQYAFVDFISIQFSSSFLCYIFLQQLQLSAIHDMDFT